MSETIQLSEQQQDIYDKYVSGKNIFITGPGGCGKTKIIQYILDDAMQRGKKVQLCAMTGCAAVLLERNAKTVHAWSGIGMANGSAEEVAEKVLKTSYKRKRWKIDLLIIDEVSMMSMKLFHILHEIGRWVHRKPQIPFGGIQVIFSGDFYQLPPVGNPEDKETTQFCFESALWKRTFDEQIELTKIFRQKDKAYIKILNQIREGRLKRSTITTLEQYVNRKPEEGNIVIPTKLLPLRRSVEAINRKFMNEIKSEEHIYGSSYVYDIPETSEFYQSVSNKSRSTSITDIDELELSLKSFTTEQKKKELDMMSGNLNCKPKLTLKAGAQVMCIVNLDMESEQQICNGSQGVIVYFENKYPVVRFHNGATRVMAPHIWSSEKIPNIGIQQIPLILSWAVTIHKSQGMTLDMAEIDVGNGIFECGQSYVALSRVKNLDGLYLTSFNPRKIRIKKKVAEFYRKLHESEDDSEHEDAEYVLNTSSLLSIKKNKKKTKPTKRSSSSSSKTPTNNISKYFQKKT